MTTLHFKPYLMHPDQHPCISRFALNSLLDKVREHKLLVLRGFHALTRDELLDYCQQQAKLLHWDFGPVMEMQVATQPKNYLFTEGDVPLHWDGAFHQEPQFLLFHCIQAPLANSGGETLFVNTEKMWQDASAKQQKEWGEYTLNFVTEKLAHYGGNIQRPLVSQHPQSQHPILRFAEPVGENYLNPVNVQVRDRCLNQSAQILKKLSQIARQPAYRYEHVWQKGDFLLADNFSLLHGRNAFKRHSPRHLRRIQIL
ncbi:MAG: TauD/TfdA family dioxygenase [Legionella sp.]|nr:MAG: TauD/TfdA family dioxygenase [Legionella sp.]